MNGPEISILSETVCRLGEGPTYDPASGTLFWFDIVGKRLLQKAWPDGETIVHSLPVMASALAVIDEKRQLLVTETGLQIRDPETNGLTLLREVDADDPVTRSNDARVHPCGALWFSTMGRNAEKKAGSIYWFFRGEVRRLYPEISIPNAICFSPDGSIAYFADTGKNIMFRVACDPKTGLPDGEPVSFIDWRRREGGLDGAVTDADGTIWNARWGAGALDAWSPEGNKIRSMQIPARQPSCPVFLGGDAARIAVTSAWDGMDEAARNADPHAGKTFLVHIDVRGRLDPRVLL